MVVFVSALPWASAVTSFRPMAMLPRWWQLPRWICETCFELAWRPLIASSSVTLPAWTCSVAVPEAVTVGSAPVTLKLSPLGEGEGLGLAAIGLGEGDGDAAAVPPPEPQAETIAASATSATTRFKPAVSLQLCSCGYHCRLLDGHSRSALITVMGRVSPTHQVHCR